MTSAIGAAWVPIRINEAGSIGLSRRVTGICLGLVVAIGYGLSCGPNAHAADVAATDSEEDRVGFVNDYATDEEIERYGLKEIWDRYKPRSKGEYWLGRKPDFTVNREDNAFLMLISYGMAEQSNWRNFLLWYDGVEIPVTLETVGGTSPSLHDRPFVLVWSLVKLEIPQGRYLDESAILPVLKSALAAFGYRGVFEQIPETTVKFTF